MPETWGFETPSTLAVIATRTSRIKLATGIINVFSRSAALIAQIAATLQTLSNGRFILGLGTSGPGVIERWHGVPYRRPIGRTRDCVNTIRVVLAGNRLEGTFEGVALQGFQLQMPPVPPVPIYIASLGPRNVRLTGEIADGWLPIFAVRGRMGGLFACLHEGASRAGRGSDQIAVAAFLPGMMGSNAEEQLRQQLAQYIGGMGSYYTDYMIRAGFGPVAREIRLAWEQGGRRAATAAVSQELLELCTLGAEPHSGLLRISEYRAQGIETPVVAPPRSASTDEIRATMRALAPGNYPL
jgi:alkanesulfonate monooxygenase SsuD/methylene tetrahydromethanopterin reductase-like flavin-dependent oxidoreductase (luciferase family)